MNNDITAGVKYEINFAGIDWGKGVRVLGLYYNDNSTNHITTIPVLRSKRDLIELFVSAQISGSLIENDANYFFASSPLNLNTEIVTRFMVIENAGSSFNITADRSAPAVVSAITVNNFINTVGVSGVSGFGTNFKLMINSQIVMNGSLPTNIANNKDFLTYLNTNFGSYGVWGKAFDNVLKNTVYTLEAKQIYYVSLLAGQDVLDLLRLNSLSAQTITFPAVPNIAHTAANYTLLATSDSGLPISYASSDVTKATIVNGNQLHPVAAGAVNITASQAGTIDFSAATPVVRAVTVT